MEIRSPVLDMWRIIKVKETNRRTTSDSVKKLLKLKNNVSVLDHNKLNNVILSRDWFRCVFVVNVSQMIAEVITQSA